MDNKEIAKALRQALNSDPHYARIIVQDLMETLDPPIPEPTIEERTEKLESMFMELVCGLSRHETCTTATRIYRREYGE